MKNSERLRSMRMQRGFEKGKGIRLWKAVDQTLKRISRNRVLDQVVRKIASLVIYYRGPLASERIVEYPFVLENLKNVSSNARILDVGSGSAPFTAELAALGYNVCAIDFLDYPCYHNRLSVVKGDITVAPFASGVFDAVVCVSTVEHIGLYGFVTPVGAADGDTIAMKEVSRITRKNGMILITVPFGRLYDSANYRVYNESRLKERLVGSLELEELRTYRYSGGKWRRCSIEEAERVDSFPGTFAVACMRLRV